MTTPQEALQRRWKAGHVARQRGALWEVQFERQCRRVGIVSVQMPLGCKRYGRRSLRQIPTPFDFTIVYKGQSIFLDLKCFSGCRIARGQLLEHQVESLFTLQGAGCTSGYLVHFHEINKVVFYGADKLKELNTGEGYSWTEGRNLGPLEQLDVRELFK